MIYNFKTFEWVPQTGVLTKNDRQIEQSGYELRRDLAFVLEGRLGNSE